MDLVEWVLSLVPPDPPGSSSSRIRFRTVSVPQATDARHANIIKRCESRKPMGIFRSADNEFLLCYDGELLFSMTHCIASLLAAFPAEFGLYVDRHGDPNRPLGVIEWEGTAERVAFHPPYVLIFDSRFIEIRHIGQGKLVQIIQGTDIHCTWDGRGNLSRSQSVVSTPGPGGWEESMHPGEAKIHAVMKSDKSSTPGGGSQGAPRGAVAQHLFELTPTQPLYPTTSLQQQQLMGSTGPNYFGLQPQPISPVHASPASSRSHRPSFASLGRTKGI